MPSRRLLAPLFVLLAAGLMPSSSMAFAAAPGPDAKVRADQSQEVLCVAVWCCL